MLACAGGIAGGDRIGAAVWYFSPGEGECPLECALSREACADREELCWAPELEDLLLRSPVVLLCMLSGSDAGAAAPL